MESLVEMVLLLWVKGLYMMNTLSRLFKSRFVALSKMRNRQKPFSDHGFIQKKLAEEGIQIARRTVSKYRESAGFPLDVTGRSAMRCLRVDCWLMF